MRLPRVRLTVRRMMAADGWLGSSDSEPHTNQL
jgi:hypothetical protein